MERKPRLTKNRMIQVSTIVRWAGRMENHGIVVVYCGNSELKVVKVSRETPRSPMLDAIPEPQRRSRHALL